jgi:hypothetical protein
MESIETSFEPNPVKYTKDMFSEISYNKNLYSNDEPYSSSNVGRISPYTAASPGIHHTFDKTATPIIQQRRGTAIPRDGTLPTPETKPDTLPTKSVCLRCRSKKSRCSGQQPCGGCRNDGLECIWDEGEPKPKRPTRKSPSTSTQASSPCQKVTKSTSKHGAHPQVRSACTRCQHRKAKCSGDRPTCSYCNERGLNCSYNVAEGTTRTNDLKRKLREATSRAHVFGLVLAVMREGSDDQATTVLAKLRMGQSSLEIVSSLPVVASCSNGEFQTELNRRLSSS